MTTIAYNHRVAIVGRTGSGKSHAARSLFLSAAEPRLVVDPNASTLTDVPGAVTVPRAPARASLARTTDARTVRAELAWALEQGAGTIRYVPADPFSADEYHAVYAWAFDNAPRFTWTDEAGIVAPANGSPKAFRRYLVQGRKRMLGHLACHTRPLEFDRNILSQANHVLLFDLPHPQDRKLVSELTSVPPRLLDSALEDLDEFEFLWFDVATKHLTHCPALPSKVTA